MGIKLGKAGGLEDEIDQNHCAVRNTLACLNNLVGRGWCDRFNERCDRNRRPDMIGLERLRNSARLKHHSLFVTCLYATDRAYQTDVGPQLRSALSYRLADLTVAISRVIEHPCARLLISRYQRDDLLRHLPERAGRDAPLCLYRR